MYRSPSDCDIGVAYPGIPGCESRKPAGAHLNNGYDCVQEKWDQFNGPEHGSVLGDHAGLGVPSFRPDRKFSRGLTFLFPNIDKGGACTADLSDIMMRDEDDPLRAITLADD